MSQMRINSININYEIEGEGYPVVLIHGLAEDLEYWKYISNYLKDYFKVIRVDLRGHGKTEPGHDRISIGLLEDDLYKLLEKLNIEKTHIIGYSLGGQVALQAVIKHQELYDKLILISTFSEVEDEMMDTFRKMYNASTIDYETFFDTIIEYILPDDMLIKYNDRLEESKNTLKDTKDIDVISETLFSCTKSNLTSSLKDIKSKTLILHGEDDPIIPESAIAKLNTNIKDSTIVEFPDTEHNVLIKKNFNKAKVLIKDFLIDN